MAKARKCDRCGSFYEKNTLHNTTGRIHGSILGGIALTDISGENDERYDLCDNCIVELFNFLNSDKINNDIMKRSNEVMKNFIEITNKDVEVKQLININSIFGVVENKIFFSTEQHFDCKETYEEIKQKIKEAVG